ncbi:MAG: FtsQ-type POTRA domain-containing protein [Actinomycetota bacterium]|nr:FtsQ-type POTRA domain-containing protein [Actinomycetota bacterium]
MEPRIRVRRAQVRRQEGRRRLRVVVAVLVVVGTALAGWGATRSPLLDVDRIVVEGAAQTGAATAARAAGVRRATPMVDVDEDAVRRRLDALPWVRSVTVRREWPGTLRIGLVERAPVAISPALNGGWALVDIEGRVLAWLSTPIPGTLAIAGVPLAGPPGTTLTPAARGLLDVAQAVSPVLRPQIVAAALDANGISLGLTSGGTILLGDPSDVVAKLRAAELVLAGVDSTNLAVLDVRLPGTPTVTRR